MASKLLINGQLFIGRTDIQSFSTQQQGGSGIEVNWGGGDIDVLTGETYQFVDHVVGGMWEFSLYRAHWSSGASKCQYIKSIRTLTASSWSNPSFGTSQIGSPPPDPVINWEQVTQANTLNQSIWSYVAGNNDSRCSGTKLWYQRRYGSNRRTLDTCINAYAFFETKTFPKVLTNTGQTSVRQTGVTPLVRVLGNECNLAITYTDGKTQILTYPECPPVAPFEDEICPQACDKANQILNRLRG
ncbi:hypothetical protein [Picosynechococcus sp. PCC 8807]|uniref:hypothetical protein n=1 Tax=Picosynechococcus sp. PCC 8807 TaxID=195248 RepID=UPI000810EA94|nr:hypothetical protein [Picosynechococcus sp. PCC 8807]ANV92029.1 hypothetical protein AWQ24_14715 [Picosynechococcus sp. PCC 8807]